jgi:hypothetical protein
VVAEPHREPVALPLDQHDGVLPAAQGWFRLLAVDRQDLELHVVDVEVVQVAVVVGHLPHLDGALADAEVDAVHGHRPAVDLVRREHKGAFLGDRLAGEIRYDAEHGGSSASPARVRAARNWQMSRRSSKPSSRPNAPPWSDG